LYCIHGPLLYCIHEPLLNFKGGWVSFVFKWVSFVFELASFGLYTWAPFVIHEKMRTTIFLSKIPVCPNLNTKHTNVNTKEACVHNTKKKQLKYQKKDENDNFFVPDSSVPQFKYQTHQFKHKRGPCIQYLKKIS